MEVFTDWITPRSPATRGQEREPYPIMNSNLLSGKNVLITGAGRNVGKSIAIEMARQGASIFFTDIEEKSCCRLEKELDVFQIRSKAFLSDISKTRDIESLCNSLAEEDIAIDILVNNVGIQGHAKTITKFDLEEWNRVYQTNVFGPMYLTKRISEIMISNSKNGCIIFVTSTHQWNIMRDASYSSSKAALGMIVRELAVDLAPHRIRVNGIAPGRVAENEQGNALRDKYTLLHNSSINPRYIGRAAVYLASDYFSKFTTGTVVTIDAGLSLYNHRVDQSPP